MQPHKTTTTSTKYFQYNMSPKSDSSSDPKRKPEVAFVLRAHLHPVTALCELESAVADAQDELRLLASGDSSGLLVVWNLRTRRPLVRQQAHHAPIVSVHVVARDVANLKDDHPAGRNSMNLQLITQSRDGQFCCWSLNQNRSNNEEDGQAHQPLQEWTMSLSWTLTEESAASFCGCAVDGDMLVMSTNEKVSRMYIQR